MLMIQSEAQLANSYGADKDTIIGNCDTYVYLGGSDIETARKVSEKADIPLKKVLNMPVGSSIIFRRGHDPELGKALDLEEFEESFGYKKPERIERPETDRRTLKERLSGKRKVMTQPGQDYEEGIRPGIRRHNKIFERITSQNQDILGAANIPASMSENTDKKDTEWQFT